MKDVLQTLEAGRLGESLQDARFLDLPDALPEPPWNVKGRSVVDLYLDRRESDLEVTPSSWNGEYILEPDPES